MFNVSEINRIRVKKIFARNKAVENLENSEVEISIKIN